MVRKRLLRVPATKSQLRRLTWAWGELRAGRPFQAGDIAARFETTLRTAYRDLDFLRDDWRVPVEYDRSTRSFRLTEPTFVLPPIALSRGELLALFFAEKALRQYRGTPFEADLRAAFGKLQELLGDPVSVDSELLDDLLSLDPGPTNTPDPQCFAEILSALRLRQVVLVRYRSLSSGRTANRRLHPYHVFNNRGDWYVAAWDSRHRDVRDFALHRMRRVASLSEHYEIPANFDFTRYAGDSFAIEKGQAPVDVAIRFRPKQARWIRERLWHRTARVEDEPGGGCVLRLRVSGMGEIKRWVMQFGEQAEVLSPETLRNEVAQGHLLAGATYSK